MTSFTDPFGGDTLPPSEYAYAAYTLTADDQLYWPFQYDGTTGLLAASILEIDPSLPGLTLALPPANQVSVGYDILVRNTGANNLDVVDYTGGAIATIVPGESRYVYVADNTTAGGLWHLFTYGTGTSAADASALAGEGLEASSGKLRTESSYRSVNSDDTVDLTDRAKSIEIVSGSITLTLPQASVATDGFYILIRNSAAGSSIVDGFGTEQIDGGLNKTLSPGESAIFICNGTYWITVGYGRDATFVFSEFVVNMAGGDITLTSADVAGRMIRLAGTAVGNLTVTLPTVDNIYFINVESGLGGFNATFTTGSGAIVTLLASQKTVLYCDGTNVNSAITTSVTSTISLDDGSAAVPSLNFSLDTDTGFFRPGSNRLGISAGGVKVAEFGSTGLTGSIVFTPVGGIAATTVEGALAELDTEKAPLASPVFTGNPTAPTPAVDDNDTSIATTAYVIGQAGAAIPGTIGTAAVGVSLRYSRQDHVHAAAASAVSNTPAGNIAAVTVQAAINELDTEKVAKAGDTMTGNLIFSGSGLRLQADLSNATASNRLAIQTSTVNGVSILNLIPNGTGASSTFAVFNGSNPDAAGYGSIVAGAASVDFAAGRNGAAAFVPLTFTTSAVVRLTLDTNGNFSHTGATTAKQTFFSQNTGGQAFWGLESSTGGGVFTGSPAYSAVFGTNNATDISFATNTTEKVRIDTTGNLFLKSTTGGLGYGTGAGGTVTQATNKSTAVTLNRPTGQITMNNAALAANTSVSFQLNNTVITAADTLIVNIQTGDASFISYLITVTSVVANAAVIHVRNVSAGSRSETLVLNFAVIKGVTS